MPFQILREDITRLDVDAIVNAANTALQMGGGVCGAIFKAAGWQQLQQACNKLAPIHTGEAVITPGFNLPAKYVIHATGPVYHAENEALCKKQLYDAYWNSLQLAKKNRCKSIAFPLISSGIYGYPKDKALQTAVESIEDFLKDNDMDVILTVFDKASFEVSRTLLHDVQSYIDERYIDTHSEFLRRPSQIENFESQIFNAPVMGSLKEINGSADLDDWLNHMDEPFSQTLLRVIDQKGKSDVEVYRRANLDRKLFSKIRKGKGYTPKKSTILALCIALELSLEETDDLLERAGYALSHADKFDVIVEYFILKGIYNIYQINEVLFEYDLPLLGSGMQKN